MFVVAAVDHCHSVPRDLKIGDYFQPIAVVVEIATAAVVRLLTTPNYWPVDLHKSL